ncbi:thermonuclease family protein [Anaerococcus martiniensis]|uniref:thermonuclease family protein n=1 Tax=Anaerococcus sp. WGS1579 TaxID=3366809 RepID=UPI00372D798A
MKNNKNNSIYVLILFIITFLLLKPDKFNDEISNNDSFYEIANVKRVVDGDTAIVTIKNKDYRVRFIGINTPEYNLSEDIIEPLGKEASEYTSKLLENEIVYLEKDTSDIDQHGRLLRYLWIKPAKNPQNPKYDEIKNQMVNAIIIDKGYSKAKNYPPDDKYFLIFKDIEREAKTDNRDKLR